jgi:two-component system phosphate regulon sensor histidine kinase PhoR
MALTSAWRRELAGIAVGALLLSLSGLWIWHPASFLLTGTVGYLSWHLLQLYRFSHWLAHPKGRVRPAGMGIWREILLTVDGLRARDRKRKRKLGRMLAGFQESTNALPDATVVLNDRSEVQWWNSAAARMLGLKRKKGKGASVVSIMQDPVFEEHLLRGDYARSLQMPAPASTDTRLEVRIVPYGKGKRLLQARDITRLLQLETVRRDFVANVSHEMRTPLTVIHGYLETMESSGEGPLAGWGKVIGQMQQQTCRMQRIVEDLLLLARLEGDESSPGQESVDVPGMLKQLYGEAVDMSQGPHRIDLELQGDLWLYANPSEIESAFSNLLFNAVRYTRAGGLITLRWGRRGEAPCFSVEDTGIGIAAEHIPRLTERFYRVDVGRSRQSGGTGLGLAIVKHVLTRHGGHLEIESRPGKGSLFSCLFPEGRGKDKSPSSATQKQGLEISRMG